MRFRSWTPFVFLTPRRYLGSPNELDWKDVNIELFSDNYIWEQDTWNGLIDVAQSPRETLRRYAGDCEDYALLIATVLNARGEDVRLGFCFPKYSPIPRHVIAYTDTRVFSSGVIREGSVEDFVRVSKYDWFISRGFES